VATEVVAAAAVATEVAAVAVATANSHIQLMPHDSIFADLVFLISHPLRANSRSCTFLSSIAH
jgi:hypothetical protein